MDLSFCRSFVLTARRAAALLLLALAALSACKGEEQEGDCAADTDCPRGAICQNAVCAQIPCFTSSECPGAQQACVAVAGDDGVDESFCSAFDCLGNNDCVVAGLGSVCVDNACFNTCSTDEECGDGKICNRNTQECVNAPTDCEDDNDCPDGKVCDADISRCVDAEENNENNSNNVNNNNPNNDNNVNNNNVNNNNPNNNNANLPPCSPCDGPEECGGDEDDCTLLDGGKFCTQGCANDSDCPTGFECARNLQNSPLQCLPIGNACVGCLLPGEACGGDQVCDPESGECVTPLDNCEACTNDAQCGPGGRCYDNNGARVCGVACTNDNSCGAGYVCSEREGARICTSLEGCEGGETCANPPVCAGDLPVLNEEFCVCVQCNADADCNDGQVCGTNFRCYTATVSCSNPEDCTDPNAPFCQGGYCIQCVSAQDCSGNPAGEFCVGGVCGGCECPEGQTCNSNGTCVEPQGCTTDADCAIMDGGGGIPGLGAQGRCDDQGACYQVGACGDSSAFANGCGMNLSCEDVFGIFPVFACVGCTDDSQCRAGEVCCPTFDGSRMVCSGIACQ